VPCTHCPGERAPSLPSIAERSRRTSWRRSCSVIARGRSLEPTKTAPAWFEARREVTPVGDHRAVPVDVRVVTATHRHLASAAERGTFRADLLARLAGFTVHLPALRERREDLGLLTAAFLGRFASDPAVAVSFTLAAARALFAHAWPLNVRELEKCIERALVIAGGKPLDLEHFPELTGAPGECVRSSAAAAVADSSALPLRPLTADEQKHREALLVLLRQHSGNISAVARATGKARNQIQRWIRRYGISREG